MCDILMRPTSKWYNWCNGIYARAAHVKTARAHKYYARKIIRSV